MQINAIQHGTGNALAIVPNTLIGAVAPTGGMAKIAALAGIHGTNQHKSAGVGKASRNPGNCFLFDYINDNLFTVSA